MSDHKDPPSPGSDAEFLGWQKTQSGVVYALYIVKAKGHPLYLSSVSEKTLRKQHLVVPPTPPTETETQGFDHEG